MFPPKNDSTTIDRPYFIRDTKLDWMEADFYKASYSAVRNF